MSGGCTDCGRKGGCDGRKAEMFSALDETLARLYPGTPLGRARRGQGRTGSTPPWAPCWPSASARACPPSRSRCPARRRALRLRLRALPRPAPLAARGPRGAGEHGRLRRRPRRRRGALFAPRALDGGAGCGGAAGDDARARRSRRAADRGGPARGGVQSGVAPALPEAGGGARGARHPAPRLREIAEPPPGFDPGGYGALYGGEPAVANYLFYPQPCSAITTTVVAFR